MTFKKWAWDLFETTGNLEAYLAIKEAEARENNKVFGKLEVGSIELDDNKKKNNDLNGNK